MNDRWWHKAHRFPRFLRQLRFPEKHSVLEDTQHPARRPVADTERIERPDVIGDMPAFAAAATGDIGSVVSDSDLLGSIGSNATAITHKRHGSRDTHRFIHHAVSK